MPRYYFHLTDGKQVLNNHKGIDLSGNAAAREDALTLARDLKHGAVMPGWWQATVPAKMCLLLPQVLPGAVLEKKLRAARGC